MTRLAAGSVVQTCEMKSSVTCMYYGIGSTGIFVEIWGVTIHVALAHKSSLSPLKANFSENLGGLAMQRAIVRGGSDLFLDETIHTGRISCPGILGVCESGLVWECDRIEPINQQPPASSTPVSTEEHGCAYTSLCSIISSASEEME